jgi:hypothetical protein
MYKISKRQIKGYINQKFPFISGKLKGFKKGSNYVIYNGSKILAAIVNNFLYINEENSPYHEIILKGEMNYKKVSTQQLKIFSNEIKI